MVNEKGRKHLPPYVSYRTFRNFIDQLQQRLPARIDRSYWGDVLSGSNGTQLMAALRFLGLIDANGKPLERLRTLVAARVEQRTALMREMASDAFKFVLNGQIDLESATYAQLQEVFYNTFQAHGGRQPQVRQVLHRPDRRCRRADIPFYYQTHPERPCHFRY